MAPRDQFQVREQVPIPENVPLNKALVVRVIDGFWPGQLSVQRAQRFTSSAHDAYDPADGTYVRYRAGENLRCAGQWRQLRRVSDGSAQSVAVSA
jgi:hypothetical protein